MSTFIGSIPNAEKDDISLAKAILKKRFDLRSREGALQIEISSHLQISEEQIYFFNRGRDSLYFFLKLLNLKRDDEVLTQAFTCIAVIAPILWSGAKPIYVDINSGTFNLDFSLLEERISSKTRAIIVQHTFGNIFNIQELRNLVDRINRAREKERKIYIIEDCAHLFPTTPKQVGQSSDMFFFSFSQDKAVSCTQGGLMHINDINLLEKAKKEYTLLPSPTEKETVYNARYLTLWTLIKETYFTKLIPFTNITVGRILILLFRVLGLIKKQANLDSISKGEIRKMSLVQEVLLLNQIKKVKKLNNHRRRLVALYNSNLKDDFRYESSNNGLLRYPILLANREEVKERLLNEKIIAGNWYRTPVHPLDIGLPTLKYSKNSCPIAERVGEVILNLPTNIETQKKDIMKIIEIINTFAIPIKI